MELYARVLGFDVQNASCGKRIKADSSACAEIGVALVNEVEHEPFGFIIKLCALGFVEISMPCEATNFRHFITAFSKIIAQIRAKVNKRGGDFSFF